MGKIGGGAKETIAILLMAMGFMLAVILGLVYSGLWETMLDVWTIRRIIVLSIVVAGVVSFVVGFAVLLRLPLRK